MNKSAHFVHRRNHVIGRQKGGNKLASFPDDIHTWRDPSLTLGAFSDCHAYQKSVIATSLVVLLAGLSPDAASLYQCLQSCICSTVSSVINSLAASFYIDVLSPYIHIKEANVNLATKGLGR